jgi:hypothetical protein
MHLREITIETDGDAIPGYIAQDQSDNIQIENEPSIHILLTEGKNTFGCKIDVGSVKMPAYIEGISGQDWSPTRWIVDGLFGCSSDISLQFTMQHKPNTEPEIKMIMKHLSAIVRVIWNGTFRYQSATSLMFIQSMNSNMVKTHCELNSLRESTTQLSKDVSVWKDTAEKLCENHWKKERDELMNNFLVLLNSFKKELRQVSSELGHQKMMNRDLHDKLQKLTSIAREKVFDHEDEHDVEIFDQKEVELLAAGKKVVYKSNDICTKPEITANDTNNRESKPETIFSRRNPVSGAIEYFDVEDIHDEDVHRQPL